MYSTSIGKGILQIQQFPLHNIAVRNPHVSRKMDRTLIKCQIVTTKTSCSLLRKFSLRKFSVGESSIAVENRHIWSYWKFLSSGFVQRRIISLWDYYLAPPSVVAVMSLRRRSPCFKRLSQLAFFSYLIKIIHFILIFMRSICYVRRFIYDEIYRHLKYGGDLSETCITWTRDFRALYH